VLRRKPVRRSVLIGREAGLPRLGCAPAQLTG
jgi:hypothetical protein